jgi:hypothetical protein
MTMTLTRRGRMAVAAKWLSVGALAAMHGTTTVAGEVTQHAARLSAELAPLGFLVGSWHQTNAQIRNVAQSRGSFSFGPVIGGRALLRRDHNNFVMLRGHDPSYEQIMLIYPEGGQLRADWFDGLHVIHYTSITVDGRTVRFDSKPQVDGASYRLTYTSGVKGLEVRFEQLRAGARAFRPIAVGTAAKG